MIYLFLYYACAIVTTMDVARRYGAGGHEYTPPNVVAMLLAGMFWPAFWVTYYPYLTGLGLRERRLAEAKEHDKRLEHERLTELAGRAEVNRLLADNPMETVRSR